MTRQKIYAKVRLSDKQYEGLEQSTRRELIRQLSFIVTPHYEYCIGAQGNYWTIVRYERVDADSVDRDSAEIVDRWI